MRARPNATATLTAGSEAPLSGVASETPPDLSDDLSDDLSADLIGLAAKPSGALTVDVTEGVGGAAFVATAAAGLVARDAADGTNVAAVSPPHNRSPLLDHGVLVTGGIITVSPGPRRAAEAMAQAAAAAAAAAAAGAAGAAAEAAAEAAARAAAGVVAGAAAGAVAFLVAAGAAAGAAAAVAARVWDLDLT